MRKGPVGRFFGGAVWRLEPLTIEHGNLTGPCSESGHAGGQLVMQYWQALMGADEC